MNGLSSTTSTYVDVATGTLTTGLTAGPTMRDGLTTPGPTMRDGLTTPGPTMTAPSGAPLAEEPFL